MAKRRSDHVPGNPLASYLQCERIVHTVAGGAGESVTDIVTGMKRPATLANVGGKVRADAWEIHAVTVKPTNYVSAAANGEPYAGSDSWCHFQLMYDEQTALIDEEDGDFDDYIAGGTVHLDLSTSGANSHFWPMALDIINPRPVFAEHLTFGSLTPNEAQWNDSSYVVGIWYAPIVLEGSQVNLLLAMRARL